MSYARGGALKTTTSRIACAVIHAPAWASALRRGRHLCARDTPSLRAPCALHSHVILRGLNRRLRRGENLCAKRLRGATKSSWKTRYCRIGLRRFWAPSTLMPARSDKLARRPCLLENQDHVIRLCRGPGQLHSQPSVTVGCSARFYTALYGHHPVFAIHIPTCDHRWIELFAGPGSPSTRHSTATTRLATIVGIRGCPTLAQAIGHYCCVSIRF